MPHLARGKAAFKIVLFEKGFDRTRKRFPLPFPKQDFFAVGEEYIGDIQLLGVGFGLFPRLDWIDRKSLGFDNGENPPVPVAEDIIGAAYADDIFNADAILIVEIPTLVFKLGINNDAGKCLVTLCHLLIKPLL